MALKTLTNKSLILALLLGVAVITGCGTGTETKKEEKEEKVPLKKPTIFQVGDEMFSIPSPVQTAIMIKESGANYHADMLNSSKSAPTYSTKFYRALNLGIYGADLAYITMYEQTQDALSYMQACQRIADELGVSNAFDRKLLKRFEANLGNKDSLLTLVTEAYRASDNFLKNNERDDVGGLILAGGWIEALYFATNVAKLKDNPNINKRIAEQKTSLENLIKLLQRYANDEYFADLVEQLADLYYMFDEMEYSYVYKKPEVRPEEKLTVINSTSSVNITDEKLKEITDQVESIRNFIIG